MVSRWFGVVCLVGVVMGGVAGCGSTLSAADTAGEADAATITTAVDATRSPTAFDAALSPTADAAAADTVDAPLPVDERTACQLVGIWTGTLPPSTPGFTTIYLRLDADGRGRGSLSLAAAETPIAPMESNIVLWALEGNTLTLTPHKVPCLFGGDSCDVAPTVGPVTFAADCDSWLFASSHQQPDGGVLAWNPELTRVR